MIIPLPETMRLDGFDLKMVKRSGRVAMFRKERSPVNTGYEVVIVQRHAERVMAGVTIPAREAMPGNELWGRAGWTCASREAADARFDSLTRSQNARNLHRGSGQGIFIGLTTILQPPSNFKRATAAPVGAR